MTIASAGPNRKLKSGIIMKPLPTPAKPRTVAAIAPIAAAHANSAFSSSSGINQMAG